MKLGLLAQILLSGVLVAWDYAPDPNHPHVAFEVWAAPDPRSQFTGWQMTTNLSVVDNSGAPQRFFKVRTLDTDTWQSSGWATVRQTPVDSNSLAR